MIKVRVTPNAKEALVTKTGEDTFEVRVDEKAVDGRANKRLCEILAEHFNVSKSRVTIIRGVRSREKTLEMHPD